MKTTAYIKSVTAKNGKENRTYLILSEDGDKVTVKCLETGKTTTNLKDKFLKNATETEVEIPDPATEPETESEPATEPAPKKERKPREKVDTFPAIIDMVPAGSLKVKLTSNGRRIVLTTTREEKEVPLFLLCRRKVGARVYLHKKGFSEETMGDLVKRYGFQPAHDEGASYPVAAVLPMATLEKLFKEC